MSMIFDGFPSIADADAFVAHIHERYGINGQTFASADEARQADPFPFDLTEPVAHIDRTFPGFVGDEADVPAATERDIAKAVQSFGGSFAGT